MEQPVQVLAASPKPNQGVGGQTEAPPIEAPTPALDLQQIKSMLNLPDTATDIELITALVNLIAGLPQKYDALLTDAVALEDKLTNRDLADFKDLVTPESEPFWRNQFLTNREGTIAVLEHIRASVPASAPAEPPQPSAPRVPLRNRLADQPRSMGELATAPAPAASLAFKIRNRAAELCKAERLNFAQAFARAEKELTPQ